MLVAWLTTWLFSTKQIVHRTSRLGSRSRCWLWLWCRLRFCNRLWDNNWLRLNHWLRLRCDHRLRLRCDNRLRLALLGCDKRCNSSAENFASRLALLGLFCWVNHFKLLLVVGEDKLHLHITLLGLILLDNWFWLCGRSSGGGNNWSYNLCGLLVLALTLGKTYQVVYLQKLVECQIALDGCNWLVVVPR